MPSSGVIVHSSADSLKKVYKPPIYSDVTVPTEYMTKKMKKMELENNFSNRGYESQDVHELIHDNLVRLMKNKQKLNTH